MPQRRRGDEDHYLRAGEGPGPYFGNHAVRRELRALQLLAERERLCGDLRDSGRNADLNQPGALETLCSDLFDLARRPELDRFQRRAAFKYCAADLLQTLRKLDLLNCAILEAPVPQNLENAPRTETDPPELPTTPECALADLSDGGRYFQLPERTALEGLRGNHLQPARKRNRAQTLAAAENARSDHAKRPGERDFLNLRTLEARTAQLNEPLGQTDAHHPETAAERALADALHARLKIHLVQRTPREEARGDLPNAPGNDDFLRLPKVDDRAPAELRRPPGQPHGGDARTEVLPEINFQIPRKISGPEPSAA